jgi:hypothetical protein
MCPANGELENGDPESPVDYLCHTAHLRARLFEWPVAPHGPCEYCEGGAERSSLEGEADRLKRRLESGFPEERPRFTFQPTLTSPDTAAGGCGPAGCGSCPTVRT